MQAYALCAQTEDLFSIRVESDLVQVHVEVASKAAMRGPLPDFWRCIDTLQQEFRAIPPSSPYLPRDCSDWMIYDLKAADLHLFEDGIEQKVQSVTVDLRSITTARDNRGQHLEWSHTPQGKWSTTDIRTYATEAFHFYNVGYVPRQLAAGNCHHIRITVDRAQAIVFAPDHYCYIPHPTTDPLMGTPLGKQLEADLNPGNEAKISLLARSNFVYDDAHRARIDIVLEFPWNQLKNTCTPDGDLETNVGILGTLYVNEHTPVARFSDSASAGNAWGPHIRTGVSKVDCINNPARLPSRYETQINLPPGKYNLRVVLGDGEKFGRADVPISIDDYDGKQLALSSAILFKRFRPASAAAQEAAYVNLAPEYVPLVSQDQQITPTANPVFPRKALIPVYFEVYEPFLAAQPEVTVKAHARMVSVKTGEIRNFNWFDAAGFRRSGGTTFAIAKEFDSTGLPKGEYRLEVQASDSAGHTTPWHSATFTLH